MKQIALLVLVILTGCQPKEPSKNSINHREIHGYEIDGCEYIGNICEETNDGRADFLTHKGDCKNPKHRPLIFYADTNLFDPSDTIN